jgi:group I intron endonuclease
MNIISGIYKIVNIKNGKMYIGSSKNIKRRWSVHKSALKNNRHHSTYLQRAWNKYGKENFVYEVIKEIPNASDIELLNEETNFVTTLKPEYNVGSIGG